MAAVLFGSVARGEATPVSNIDLMVIASGLPEGGFGRMNMLAETGELLEPKLAELRQRVILIDLCTVS